MSSVDRYRRWFEYEKDSHAKVLESLERLPAEARDKPEYRKAVELVSHLAAARRLWMYRLGVVEKGPSSLFGESPTLEQAAAQLREVHELWDGYFRKLDKQELDREFEYQSLEGAHYRNRVEDIVSQLFGHSLYHRGQIALLVRSMGGEPAETDLIFWTREEIED